eukprot:XP_001693006.1 predicted protein [Chlamydomonas reinhardtii]
MYEVQGLLYERMVELRSCLSVRGGAGNGQLFACGTDWSDTGTCRTGWRKARR